MSEKFTLAKRLCLCAILMLISILTKAQMAPQFSATPLAGCAPLVVHFTDETTGGATQWKWDLGNSTVSFLQNPSAIYSNPGTYTVKLVVQNAAGTKDSIIKTQYITVYALPTVSFTASPLTGCYPLPVQFTDNSTPGSGTAVSWLRDFGDGNSANTQNPAHVYTASGNYNVSLQVTNSNGCSKTLTRTNYISITAGVHAAFTNSAPTGCSAPETITFQNQSTGTGALTYEWHFGDGGLSTASDPSHVYSTAGTYTVQLITTNSNGCRDTATHNNIITIGTVHADFTAPLTACAGTVVTLVNTSNPAPSGATWTFGDATTSTDLNPIKIYTAAGTYNIKLVSNFGGCTDNITKSITIYAKPISAFTGSPLSSCSAPLTVNFTDNSTGALSYQWSFGDGNTSTLASPSNTYTAPGLYTVKLITTNVDGCTDTLVKTDYINIKPPVATIDNLPQQGCAPFEWAFSSTVTTIDPVVSYQWDFGDGTTSSSATPTHIFAAGEFDIKLIITTATGCTDTVIVVKGIKSTLHPHADFDADPRDVCARVPVNFHDLSTATVTNPTWNWSFGDGSTSSEQNPSHVYQDTGYFNITLIVGNNGCYDTLVRPNYIHVKPPIAIFSTLVDCINKYTRVFTDASIGADEWHWTFGDGATSDDQNPTHTYATVGTYTVTLTVVNHQTGCDFTKTSGVTIAEEHANFTADKTELCRNSSLTFTATSVHAVPAIITYDWSFGDGATATGPAPSHTYVQAGTYDVRLIITDVNGCRDTMQLPQYIHVYGPVAGFTPSVPGSCLNTAITFNDQSASDGIHPITTWHWYYGDGIHEALTTPPFTHAYADAGIYSVSLALTDTYGCTDSIAKINLLTISTPQAIFASTDTASCPGKNVVFTNASTGPSLTYHWEFGDGTSDNSITPTHVYAADGSYDITLTVTDVYGCVSTLTKPQYIKIFTPVASFTVSDSVSTCPPLIVQFTNTSQHVESFVWDFGDGNTSTNPNPSHFYNVAGSYVAKLTVTSPGGCVSVKTKPIIVNGPSGTFTYTPITGCSPLTVGFTATTQSTASFVWDFNDGNTIATADPALSHTYTIPGIYVPKMILKDIAGCTVTINGIDTITVNGVQADFAADTLLRCNSGNIVFTNNSTSNDVITDYKWEFGDGNTSTDFEPTHFYAATGIYTTQLIVTTLTGCIDTMAMPSPIKVVKIPEISYTQSPNGCVPMAMHFDGNLLNADTSAIQWNWSFSDGTTATGQHTPSLNFATAGTFSAQLTAINSSGCTATTTGTIEVYPKPVIDAGQDITICQHTGKTLTATGAATYVWSPALGLSCTNCASPTATPDVASVYAVTGTSTHGCINTDTVKVNVNFPFTMTNSPGDTLCRGQNTTLSASDAVTYAWSPATGLNTTTGNTVTANPSTTTTYMAVGFDGKNCFTDTAYYLVKVYPIPTVSAGIDKTINVGQTTTLTPVISPDVNSVVWSPTVGVVTSTYPSIEIKPNVDMQYTVKVANAGGCTAKATINIHVLCNGANVFIPNTFSPNGDGANEIFYPRGTGLFTIKAARIFNRWGEQMYEQYNFNANDPTKGWDGTYKGQKMGADVYVYMFEILCENNTTLVYKGNIALIK